MARPSQFDPQRILEATRELVVVDGPSGATMQAIARRMGGPTGSIYHRFASRSELLAHVWLDAVESFQDQLLGRAAQRDITPGAVARFVIDWARAHPENARILLLHRSDDFADGQWPDPLTDRAKRLRRDLAGLFRRLARRWLDTASRPHIETVVLAVADLPRAALRRYLTAPSRIPRHLAGLVADAADAIVNRAHAEKTS